MERIKHFALVRFSRRTGKIDTTLTALGSGMLQLWALQNTTKTKVSIIIDLDEGVTFKEFHGSPDGMPKVKHIAPEFDVPPELIEILRKECDAE